MSLLRRRVAVLALVLTPTVALADLAPHRVVYDLALVRSAGTRSIEDARGRIAFDFTGDACEGYALRFRQVTEIAMAESGRRVSDLRTATFESPDGSSFRFKIDSVMEPLRRQIDGEAERDGDGQVVARLKAPKRDHVALNGRPVFPTAHMRALIEAARAGRPTLAVQVFDGAEDGEKVYDTLAVIGRRIGPGEGAAVEPALAAGPMADQPRWPVKVTYFAPGQGERTPLYSLSFELYENGISRALVLDYGEFALTGTLSSFELLPAKPCAAPGGKP
jgi:hypothetical protein